MIAKSTQRATNINTTTGVSVVVRHPHLSWCAFPFRCLCFPLLGSARPRRDALACCYCLQLANALKTVCFSPNISQRLLSDNVHLTRTIMYYLLFFIYYLLLFLHATLPLPKLQIGLVRSFFQIFSSNILYLPCTSSTYWVVSTTYASFW